MNNKIKSLIKIDSFLVNRNTKIMFYFIGLILIGPVISITTALFNVGNMNIFAIIVSYLLVESLFVGEFVTTYLYDENIKDYIQMLPVSKKDYVKAKFYYGLRIIIKILILFILSTQYIVRNIQSINVVIYSVALGTFTAAFKVKKFFGEKKYNKKYEKISSILWLVLLNIYIIFSEDLVKIGMYLNKTKLIQFLNVDLKNGFHINGIILLIMSIIFYLLMMLLTINKEEKR